MKRLTLLISISLVIVSAFDFPGPGAAFARQAPEKKEYVCPPCGCDKDNASFDKPGGCPTCGMALVEKGSVAAASAVARTQPERKKAAILIFDGVQIIDYTGPYEVFGQAGFDVYTVAEKTDPLTTSMGMKVIPSFTFENSPRPDVVIIPGGNVLSAQNNPAVIKWIQEKAKEAEHVLSVCNGAFILARTGLLDGLSATTFYGLLEGFAAAAPKTKVVDDQRYVDNGKIITTAGLSSGIDGSLYVITKMFSKARAQMVALNMEYNWQPGSGYARAAFADRNLRRFFPHGYRIDLPQGVDHRLLSTEGGADSWEVKWQARGEITASELLKHLDARLAGEGKWDKQESAPSNGSTKSSWKFSDDKGKPWKAESSVEPGAKGQFVLTLKLARGLAASPAN